MNPKWIIVLNVRIIAMEHLEGSLHNFRLHRFLKQDIKIVNYLKFMNSISLTSCFFGDCLRLLYVAVINTMNNNNKKSNLGRKGLIPSWIETRKKLKGKNRSRDHGGKLLTGLPNQVPQPPTPIYLPRGSITHSTSIINSWKCTTDLPTGNLIDSSLCHWQKKF